VRFFNGFDERRCGERLGQVGNTARRDCARAVRFAVIAGDIDDRQTYPAIREAPAQLDAGFSYGNLIGVASPQDPTQTRVIPGDPDKSLIIQKLEGRRFDNAPILGARMPDGGPYLQQSTIDVIRLWIANGAQQ